VWKLGASELAASIRAKRVSVHEVVEAHLRRIEAANPLLNAVTVVLADRALGEARVADDAIARGDALGPLHGVPMTVKENIDLAGSPTTMGVTALAGDVPPVDAPHIAQLRAAGAIVIGRTNTPEFGMRWHTDNDLRGATRNPWDAGRTPGGSSGGDAAALAAGLVPLGMGNDYAGSIRWPSQCCGTTGLRTSFGRVPRARTLPGAPQPPLTVQLFAVHGPMARHVRDLRLALESMSGYDPRDPWNVAAPLRGPEPRPPIRVALTVDPGGLGVDEGVAEAVRQAARALADEGYAVEEVEPPQVVRAAQLYVQLLLTPSSPVPTQAGLISAGMARFGELNREAFLRYTTDASPDPFAERFAVALAWSEFHAEYPLVLGPVATMPAFPVGSDVRGADWSLQWLHAIRLIVTVNLLGLPSVAVPVGVADGLPQGVQVIASRFREDLCLDAAEAIERRLGTITPIDPKL
jgi:amidase